MTSMAFADDGCHGEVKKHYRFNTNDDGQSMKPKFDPDEARAAALTVAAHATDVEDARLLLAMCGLLPEGAREPGARAARWDTSWEGK